MQQDPVTQYFELRRQLFELEARIEAIKPAATAQVRQLGGLARLDGYTLHIRAYTAWDYSSRVVALQQELNDAKRRERQDGTARVRERLETLALQPTRETADLAREEPANALAEWETEES